MKQLLTTTIFLFLSFMCIKGQNTTNWQQLADMPTSRFFSHAITIGDKIYVFGGNNTGAVEAYSPEKNTWETKKSFPGSELYWCGVENIGDTVYAVISIGEQDDCKYLVIAAYSISNDNWTRIDSTSTPTNDPGVTLWNRNIYIISGFIHKGNTLINVDTVKEFNIDTKKWSLKKGIPSKRHTPVVKSFNSKIYVFGGVTDAFDYPPSKTVQVFDPQSNTWSDETSGNLPLAYARASFNYNRIYFTFENKVAVYDTINNSWTTETNIPHEGEWYSHAFYKNKLYIFGGINSTQTALKKAYAYIPGSMATDIEGNVYRTVKIGDQIWMQENLRSNKLNDNTAIPLVTNDNEWENLRTPAYCWYNNNKPLFENYGALYNRYTINTGKICPNNWHMPNDNDWAKLVNYLGNLSISGGKLKEAGLDHWKNPNTGATNKSGFTALPAGYRQFGEGFFDINNGAYWWAGSETGLTSGWGYETHYNSQELSRCTGVDYETFGFSVRCIKNNPASYVSKAEANSNFSIYPNPVITHATISFRIDNQGYTSLKIFNALGEVVATLIEKELVPGNYNIEWNTKAIKTGTYFCQLTRNSDTKRINIVVKH